jgi:hypothetical protein
VAVAGVLLVSAWFSSSAVVSTVNGSRHSTWKVKIECDRELWSLQLVDEVARLLVPALKCRSASAAHVTGVRSESEPVRNTSPLGAVRISIFGVSLLLLLGPPDVLLQSRFLNWLL